MEKPSVKVVSFSTCLLILDALSEIKSPGGSVVLPSKVRNVQKRRKGATLHKATVTKGTCISHNVETIDVQDRDQKTKLY